MELQFTKDAHGMWVSEFEVNSDFNLHIERTKGGIISLYQRTTGGGWDHVDAFEYVRHQASIDFDCTALVYPKWCKIESEVEPSYAAITTDGEVTEIKSQSKEVEITSNGVTEIAPDAGFGYLSGVKVNVNVPTGGGSGGTEGGGSSDIVYLNVSAFTGSTGQQIKKILISLCDIAVYTPFGAEYMWYGPAGYVRPLLDDESKSDWLKRMSFDRSQKLHMGLDFEGCTTVGEALIRINFDPSTQPELAAMLLTEEEFYNFEA